MNKKIFCGVAATACWGLSNVLSKSLLAHFEPLSLLAIQLIVSNIFLWIFLAFQEKPHLSGAASFKYSLPGILQPGMAFIFGIFGLNLTTANSDSLIWVLESIVIIFLASLLLREHVSRHMLMLAIGGTCGTLLATNSVFDMHFNASMLSGNALIFGGVICAAFYSIYSQRQLINIDPLRLTALHQLSGCILVIGIWLACFPLLGVSQGVSSLDLILAMVSGVTAFALPFCLYLSAAKDLGAAKTSIFLVLPPIFTICGSFIFLGERLNCLQWVGVALALAAATGICLSQTSETAHRIVLE